MIWRGDHPAPQPGFRSPIEQQFWDACIAARPRWFYWLVPQQKAARFRIDFALPSYKIGIELDGFRDHSKVSDVTRDHVRQRWLGGLGWYIIRFGGGEITHYSAECVRQVDFLIDIWGDGPS